KRVYVGCFLLLVSCGFVFLTIYINKRKSIGWLIKKNLIAVGVLFFVLQFLDVKGWVARYDLNLWRENPERQMLAGFYDEMGPAGWPMLIEMVKSGGSGQAIELARTQYWKAISIQIRRSEEFSWPEYEWRTCRLRKQLLESNQTKVRKLNKKSE
ncbi:MAG: DUF4153 domain-containing protein, partial [Planctomycetota bacterium]